MLIGLLKSESGNTSYDIYHETSLAQMPEFAGKKIMNLYDLSFLSCPEFLVKDFAHYARENVKRNVLFADRIIVNTGFIKGEALNFLRIPEEKIDVIPLAPSSIYCLIGEYKAKPRKITKLTKKDYILYVGTVEPRKNLKILIRAFKEIRERYDTSLVIAGRLGWLYDDIVKYPEELGIREDVIFTGYVDEESLLYLYNHASVFVYPSLYEGFGLPPLEAMACGTPVIISEIPPLKEVAGDAAIAFNPKDHEELAGKIETVISSDTLRSDMIQRGFERVKGYSWSKTAALTIETYKRAIES
ncbi:MAG: glycosyltransferase family 1 protein [Thermodesulfovibrionales bacterium]